MSTPQPGASLQTSTNPLLTAQVCGTRKRRVQWHAPHVAHGWPRMVSATNACSNWCAVAHGGGSMRCRTLSAADSSTPRGSVRLACRRPGPPSSRPGLRLPLEAKAAKLLVRFKCSSSCTCRGRGWMCASRQPMGRQAPQGSSPRAWLQLAGECWGAYYWPHLYPGCPQMRAALLGGPLSHVTAVSQNRGLVGVGGSSSASKLGARPAVGATPHLQHGGRRGQHLW